MFCAKDRSTPTLRTVRFESRHFGDCQYEVLRSLPEERFDFGELEGWRVSP